MIMLCLLLRNRAPYHFPANHFEDYGINIEVALKIAEVNQVT
jgi:hypothetical protein